MDSATPQRDLSAPKAPEPSSATLGELQYHFEGLRGLVLLALVGLIVGTLAVDLCFLRGWMLSVRNQLDAQRAQVSKVRAAHKKDVEPIATNFLANLQNYAATNQDFQPILDKYRSALWPYMQPAAAPSTTLQPVQVPPK